MPDGFYIFAGGFKKYNNKAKEKMLFTLESIELKDINGTRTLLKACFSTH